MARISASEQGIAAGVAAPFARLNEAAPSCAGRVIWAMLVGLVAVALCAPFLRSVFWLGDEGVLLVGADRMLHGSRLYADFFEFLPPGGFVITAGWFAIAGISLGAARILAILTIAGIACFTYLACREVSRNPFYSALIVIAWLVMTQGYWTEISHHWFTTLFAMIAAWAATRNANESGQSLHEPIIAGLAAGAAAMVVPTRGALVMLAGLAAFAGTRGSRAQLIAYVLASLVVPAALFAWVAASGTLIDAFGDVIVFTANQYASFAAAPYGYFANLQNYPLLFFFPIMALVTLLASAWEWRTGGDGRRLRTVAAFGLAGFIGCFPRPDMSHLGFAVPLACPALLYGAKRLTAGPWRRYRVAAAALAVMLCLPSGLAYWLIAQEALHAERVPTARGEVSFLYDMRPATDLAAQIGAAPAADAYFFYPLMPLMAFLTGREQVSKYDVFTPGYTLPSQYREACIAAAQQAAWVVIDRNWTDAAFLRKIFPGLQNPEREETKRFETALRAGFALAGSYGPFELRHRDGNFNQIDCAG